MARCSEWSVFDLCQNW